MAVRAFAAPAHALAPALDLEHYPKSSGRHGRNQRRKPTAIGAQLLQLINIATPFETFVSYHVTMDFKPRLTM